MPLTLALAIAALTLLRGAVAAGTGLTDDEAYYRLWALAPAVSYYDHPPMVAWMMAAGRWIAGDNQLGLRLPAVTASLFGPFVLWRSALILFGERIAERAVWLALAMPLLAVGSVVMTPDTPSVLFWGLSSWALAELYASRNATWWLAVGAFAGLGLLSKYTNLFLGAGIALWLSGLPENRQWLRSWQLWAGGALAAILVLPVIVWNLEHDWASFAKQFGRVGRGESLTLRYLVEFVGSYVGLASPVIAAFSLWGLGLVVRSATAKRDPSHALVAAGILPLLIYFLVHALRQRVQANWAAPLYPALAICAALALAQLSGASGRRLSLAAVALGLAMSVLLYVHIVHPMVRLSNLRDSTAQMRGWPELAANLERLRVANSTQWIATSSYATTGQLAFALRGGPPVIQLTERLRYANLPAPNETTLRSPGLYVELDRRENPELLRERFGSVISLGHLVRRDNDGPIASFAVYRISDPRGLVLR